MLNWKHSYFLAYPVYIFNGFVLNYNGFAMGYLRRSPPTSVFHSAIALTPELFIS